MEGINKPEVNMSFLHLGTLMTPLFQFCLGCEMNRNNWKHSIWSLEDTGCRVSFSLMNITEGLSAVLFRLSIIPHVL